MKNECAACKDPFRWSDEVIVVNDEIYHKDCVDIVPLSYGALLDGEFLGETENEDGSMACDFIDDLLNDEQENFAIGDTVKHLDAAYSENFIIVEVCSVDDENDFIIQGPTPKYEEPFAVSKEKLLKV